MPEKSNTSGEWYRNIVACGVLIVAVVSIVSLGLTVILQDKDNALNTFNLVLPVLASWVATVLVFYFGRENFESASRQVREMADKLSPEQRAKTPVMSVMRRLSDMTCFKIAAGKGDKDIKLSELTPNFTGSVSRLPVVDAQNRPKYMLHQSRIDQYIAGGGKPDDTLEKFITDRKATGIEFGLKSGFVVVSEKTTLADAKRKMEGSCQDIFITVNGEPDEPLTGWISNVRLGKYLEA